MDRDAAWEAAVLDIQGAALEPQRWSAALEKLDPLLGASCAGLFVHDLTTAEPLSVEDWRIDPGSLQDYADHYHKVDDLLFAGMQLPQDRIVCGQELVLREEYLQSEHYNDFWKPLGLSDLLTVFPLKTDRHYSHFGFFYPDEFNDPGGTRRRTLASLVPFVRMSITMQLQLSELQIRVEALEAAFDSLSVGVVILGPGGRMRELNHKARDILGRNDGFTDLGGTLRAMNTADAEPLDDAIRRATRRTGALSCGSEMAISRTNGKRPYHVTVAPIPQQSANRIGWAELIRPRALLFIRDGDDVAIVPADYLRAAFGLTQTEAEVVVALANGRSIKEQAETSERSLETLRAHIKSVMSKTETHSQSELVRLVMSAAAVLSNGET